MTGRVHSIQSLGTLDGPGVRCVVFMQGCPLRCKCCHNPDTWDFSGGTEMTAEEVFQKVLRFRSYFGKNGGVTLSGGEPLCQPGFVYELFRLCREAGIHTCLDTSGAVCDSRTEKLLTVTDLCLLDVKMDTPGEYLEFCGGDMEKVMAFLEKLQQTGTPAWIRRVIIPGVNDSETSVKKLRELISPFSCVEKTELLPFRKLCISKYRQMGITFPLADTPEADPAEVEKLSGFLT